MRKFKIILSMCLIAVLFVGSGIDAFASPIFSEVEGDAFYTYELDNFETDSSAQLLKKKNAEIVKFKSMKSYPTALTLSITHFSQETSYYCGPATVKQVVHWINGSSSTQTYYATVLGTTTQGTVMSSIPSVLNTEIGEQYYVKASIGSQSQWMDKIRSSLYNDRPAILDIKTVGITEFPYSSNGHYVNVSGYSDSSATVRITDPNDSAGNVWYAQSVLFSANNAHPNQSIIW